MSAFERYSLGWLEPRRLEISDTTFVLKSILENDGLVLTSDNDNEYYFVDFRLQEDFDKGLTNQGLLIWHINYNRYNWMANEVNSHDPMGVDLVEADGRADSYTVSSDAFPSNRVNSFNGFVKSNGDSLGLEIYDIQIVDDHVEFKTRGKRVSPVPESSSSSAKVSSSSKAESSSSVKDTLSVQNVSSSSQVSSVLGSSSSANHSKNSAESSSSEEPMILSKQPVSAAAHLSVVNGSLMVNTKIAGRKTVNLFDVNGTLLMTKSFSEESCEIRMGSTRDKAVVIVTLEHDGRVIKSYKVRMN
jgi:hypothetical protein